VAGSISTFSSIATFSVPKKIFDLGYGALVVFDGRPRFTVSPLATRCAS